MKKAFFILVLIVSGLLPVMASSCATATRNIDGSLVTVRGSNETEVTGVVAGDGSQVVTVWDFEASPVNDFQVVTPGGKTYDSSIQGFSSPWGLLLLDAKGMKLPAASFGNTARLAKGQAVTVSTIGDSGLENYQAQISMVAPTAGEISLAQPSQTGHSPFVGTGSVVTDTHGLVLGMVGLSYESLNAHSQPPGFSCPAVNADLMKDLLSRTGTPAAIDNGPLEMVTTTTGETYGNVGLFKNYAAITRAFADAENEMGAPLPESEVPKNGAIVDAPETTTVAYAFPVDLRSPGGTVLATARWVTVKLSSDSTQPSRLYYGGGIGKVDGGFLVTGNLQALKQVITVITGQ